MFELGIETYETKMEGHAASLEAGHLLYFNKDLEAADEDGFVTVDQYRAKAKGYTLWSPVRFDAVVGFVQLTPATRLISFVDPCGDANMHLLCVQFVGTEEHPITYDQPSTNAARRCYKTINDGSAAAAASRFRTINDGSAASLARPSVGRSSRLLSSHDAMHPLN
jgi:hypothetical protein